MKLPVQTVNLNLEDKPRNKKIGVQDLQIVSRPGSKMIQADFEDVVE